MTQYLKFVLNDYLFSDDEQNNLWPEILRFLFECVQSGETALKDSALHIFRLGFDNSSNVLL